MATSAMRRAESALLSALKLNNPDLDEYPESYLLWIARELAHALAVREGSSTSRSNFADRVRQVCFNLPKPHNHTRRRALCNRTLSPSAISELDTAAWASQERQAEKRAESAKRRRLITIVNDAGAIHTRSVTCSACSSRDAVARIVGDQRDSRKGETWGSKDHDEASHRARLECNVCGNVWHSENLIFDEPAVANAVGAQDTQDHKSITSPEHRHEPKTEVHGEGSDCIQGRHLPATTNTPRNTTSLPLDGAEHTISTRDTTTCAFDERPPGCGPSSRSRMMRRLGEALLVAAGPLGVEHDAFLGTSPYRLAAEIEDTLWRACSKDSTGECGSSKLQRLREHERRVESIVVGMTSSILDELVIGDRTPEQIALDVV